MQHPQGAEPYPNFVTKKSHHRFTIPTSSYQGNITTHMWTPGELCFLNRREHSWQSSSWNFPEFISRPIIQAKSMGEGLHHNRRHTHNPSLSFWLQTSSKLQRRNSKPWRARKSSVRFPTLFTSAYLYSSCQEAGSHAGTTGFLFMSGSMTANLCPISMTSKLFWPLSKSQVWWNVLIETHNFFNILFNIFVKSKSESSLCDWLCSFALTEPGLVLKTWHTAKLQSVFWSYVKRLSLEKPRPQIVKVKWSVVPSSPLERSYPPR